MIPDHWRIYYKEHPRIFDLPGEIFYRGQMYRNSEYYNALVSYKKVHIIPLKYNSFDLIDSAKVTVTATGTVAFESAVRGTPALVFGSVWFDRMEGVTRVNKKEDVVNLIEQIESGYEPDIDRIYQYVQNVWTQSSPYSPDLLYEDLGQAVDAEYQNGMERLMRDYNECLKKIYGSIPMSANHL